MDIREVIETLTEIDRLLTHYKVAWRKNTQEFLEMIDHCSKENSNALMSTVQKIRSVSFGSGMGSLVDFYMSRDNGDDVLDEPTTNKQLRILRRRFYRQLNEILD